MECVIYVWRFITCCCCTVDWCLNSHNHKTHYILSNFMRHINAFHRIVSYIYIQTVWIIYVCLYICAFSRICDHIYIRMLATFHHHFCCVYDRTSTFDSHFFLSFSMKMLKQHNIPRRWKTTAIAFSRLWCATIAGF